MTNRLIVLFLVLSTVYGCRNYDSERYINCENEAINDILRQLIDYDEMVKMNDFDTTRLTLLLISRLDTITYDIYEPDGYVISTNGVKLPDSEIKENKKDYEERLEKFKKEQRLFAPLKNGKFKQRILDYKFEYSNLQVELIPEFPNILELKQNEYGFLYISRIIFNRSIDKGFLSYSFLCGEGCYWAGNIEIIKINGKWEISEFFSGGIAQNGLNALPTTGGLA